MVFVLTLVVLLSISFANHALTAKTTFVIQGSAPYLTFDGGSTRVTNTKALLWISLSDGRTFTPTTNDSSLDNPIFLPVAGQSFADIGMLVPTDTNIIALSSLIGTPYNYWGDDDGDGQGFNGVTATGGLYLDIFDKDKNRVARNEVLDICKAPYKLVLSNFESRLTTRYGVPNETRFRAGNATYYINPKKESSPVICYAMPNLSGFGLDGIPGDKWYRHGKGFLTQSVTPSSYGSNFPTTGANNLYFDLAIVGNNQALSWAPVSHGGITATMTNSTSTSVRVTLTGPVATPSQWSSNNPGQIDRLSLPQVFELVGRDSSGNAVVKYGFELKQWFVSRGEIYYPYLSTKSWCNNIGYRLPTVSDLTNATCQPTLDWQSQDVCEGAEGATPSSPKNYYRRHMGGGFFSEWGRMDYYANAHFGYSKGVNAATGHWTQDSVGGNPYRFFVVNSLDGTIYNDYSFPQNGLCVYP
ncbi:hypothetical protein [Gilliamella apis]|uniref:hypothetical protein n=1 Tax=Gilliamella apis TaxID=1970738 RepID=UPI00080D9B9B|nr:hypothetical protein [Gilliamella apis]OCG02657.1 hypothetical protein A9G19_06990 [Gilliamella apis]